MLKCINIKSYKNIMYRFCWHKYSFKLTWLWRKLEFYTRVDKKMCFLLLFKSFKLRLWFDHDHAQDFPNSSKAWGEFSPVVGNWKFCRAGGGEFFYQVVGTWEGVILTNQPFSKQKTAFCECWTSIKIKINMTCVSKEYESKTIIVHEQWLQLKMLFLLGYNLKIVI